MTSIKSRARRLASAAIVLALAAAGALVAAPAATADTAFPDFVFQGVITDKSEMIYNPTNEFIFPSVFHAGQYFDDALGEWYLYLAPHNAPAGIMLMYADSLDGPWTEYEANPIIESEWEPYYDVSHISSPDAIWNDEADELFLYMHGENSVTRYATSDDGIHFDYGDIVVSTADGGPGVTETSYARVFEHPDPHSDYRYGMFYMANYTDNHRRLRSAQSVDGIRWDVNPDPVVEPEDGDSGNVSGGNYWEYDGQGYVIYHNSTGNVMARTIDDTLTQAGEAQLLRSSSGVGADTGRVAAPEIITDDTGTYMFYESGDRLGATISYAKVGGELPPGDWPADASDPLYGDCPTPGSDEFGGDALSDDWDRVVRPDAARHVVADGELTIPTYAGGVTDASHPQQELPGGHWQVTTKVTIDATQKYQQAGILLYASDTVYGKFDFGRAASGKTLEVVRYLNGDNRQNTAAPAVPDADTVYLRLTSDGSLIQPSVSYDGAMFSNYGQAFDLAETPFSHFGPYAFRGATAAPEIPATFDWWRYSPTPSEYEDCVNAPSEPPDSTDGSTEAPGVGSLTTTSGWANGLSDGTFEVRMNLWWGSNAGSFRLFENGELLETVALTPTTPQAQSAVVPITGRSNGTYVYVGELVNDSGVTATSSVTVEVDDATPAVPVLSSDNWDRDGEFTLTANLWWGTNATSWRLLQDGEEIARGQLEAVTPAAQHVSTPISGVAVGSVSYVMEFSNAAGTTASEPLLVDVTSTASGLLLSAIAPAI